MSPSRSASASPAAQRRTIQSGSCFFIFSALRDFSALFVAAAAANYADHYGAIEAVKWAACEKNICLS